MTHVATILGSEDRKRSGKRSEIERTSIGEGKRPRFCQGEGGAQASHSDQTAMGGIVELGESDTEIKELPIWRPGDLRTVLL